jgi:hypothetical protein
MGRPVIRTPSGERLTQWFLEQHNALSSAIEECSTEAREYIKGQLKTLDRVRDHVLGEVAYCEVEAIAMVTDGATLSAADQWLTDAMGGEDETVAA